MKKKITKEVLCGNAPLHLNSLEAKNMKKTHIYHTRISKLLKTNSIVLTHFYKSPL